MFKNWIECYKRNSFLKKEIAKLVDKRIDSFTSTEAIDCINNVCNYEYTRQEVNSELVDQGFYLNGFEWRLPAESTTKVVESTTKVVDTIILLMMAAFIGFACYLIVFKIFG